MGKLRAEQLDLNSMKKTFATLDAVTGASKKDLLFVIPRVTLGQQKIEIPFPYKGNASKILVSLPVETLLSEALVIEVECYQDGVWKKVGTVTVPEASISASAVVNPAFAVDNNIFRVYVQSFQEGLSNMVVTVTISGAV